VNRFAALLDALLFTPSRNGKLRLMKEYFGSQPDPERGWALAALTSELIFDAAKPSQVRALAAARVDPELLGWSYDFVGDLAETVSLIWPETSPVGGHIPSLAEIVEQLKATSRKGVGSLLEPWLDALDATGRWALLKLVTRELRIGVSPRPRSPNGEILSSTGSRRSGTGSHPLTNLSSTGSRAADRRPRLAIWRPFAR
jgi:DNA ligase-1